MPNSCVMLKHAFYHTRSIRVVFSSGRLCFAPIILVKTELFGSCPLLLAKGRFSRSFISLSVQKRTFSYSTRVLSVGENVIVENTGEEMHGKNHREEKLRNIPRLLEHYFSYSSVSNDDFMKRESSGLHAEICIEKVLNFPKIKKLKVTKEELVHCIRKTSTLEYVKECGLVRRVEPMPSLGGHSALWESNIDAYLRACSTEEDLRRFYVCMKPMWIAPRAVNICAYAEYLEGFLLKCFTLGCESLLKSVLHDSEKIDADGSHGLGFQLLVSSMFAKQGRYRESGNIIKGSRKVRYSRWKYPLGSVVLKKNPEATLEFLSGFAAKHGCLAKLEFFKLMFLSGVSKTDYVERMFKEYCAVQHGPRNNDLRIGMDVARLEDLEIVSRLKSLWLEMKNEGTLIETASYDIFFVRACDAKDHALAFSILNDMLCRGVFTLSRDIFAPLLKLSVQTGWKYGLFYCWNHLSRGLKGGVSGFIEASELIDLYERLFDLKSSMGLEEGQVNRIADSIGWMLANELTVSDDEAVRFIHWRYARGHRFNFEQFYRTLKLKPSEQRQTERLQMKNDTHTNLVGSRDRSLPEDENSAFREDDFKKKWQRYKAYQRMRDLLSKSKFGLALRLYSNYRFNHPNDLKFPCYSLRQFSLCDSTGLNEDTTNKGILFLYRMVQDLSELGMAPTLLHKASAFTSFTKPL